MEALDQGSASSSDDEEPAAGAISHTSTQGLQERRSALKAISRKRRQAVNSSDISPSAKKPKVEPMFTAVEGADGQVLCLYVTGECIPLWPQYVDKAGTCNFIRVTSSEDWVNKFMVASRKACKGDMSHGKEKDALGKDKRSGRSIL